jgi:ABC-type transporter Mla MlaB component
MLRLTLDSNGSSGPAIRAEGRLVGEWATLLEAECARLLNQAPSIELNLAEVTDVDASGIAVLRRLRILPVVLVRCSPILLGLLTEDGRA